MNAFEQAMEKIRDEMAKKSGGPGIETLGEYLTERLTREPALAQKLLNKDKTLHGAFAAIREEARKRQKGGFAYIGPEEAYALTCRYFGIGEEAEAPAPEPAPRAADGALDLDALLDG